MGRPGWKTRAWRRRCDTLHFDTTSQILGYVQQPRPSHAVYCACPYLLGLLPIYFLILHIWHRVHGI